MASEHEKPMTISKEAIEAAARALCPIDPDSTNECWFGGVWYQPTKPHWEIWQQTAERALTASLPFLALRPAPSQSDEARAHTVAHEMDSFVRIRGEALVADDCHQVMDGVDPREILSIFDAMDKARGACENAETACDMWRQQAESTPRSAQSDEELGSRIARRFVNCWQGHAVAERRREAGVEIAAALATVRAEATLAGAAAEREAVADMAERMAGGERIAATIRARK